jgi:hypothetical protein
MGNNWSNLGIPQKGWELVDVYDVREDGQSVQDTDYETCMMCNNERIRYVHVLVHKDIKDKFKVGCICAEKMTDDPVTPKLLEERLRQSANRKINYAKRKWKVTQTGNYKLKFEGHFLLIFYDNKTAKYKGKIDSKFGRKSFETIIEAKMALLKGIDYYKLKYGNN